MSNFDKEIQLSNYAVHLADIADTLFAKQYTKELSPKQLNAVLHMFGLDIKRTVNMEVLGEGSLVRSYLTGGINRGGYLYSGYERTDKQWKKYGLTNIQKYLYTPEGVSIFIDVIEGNNKE